MITGRRRKKGNTWRDETMRRTQQDLVDFEDGGTWRFFKGIWMISRIRNKQENIFFLRASEGPPSCHLLESSLLRTTLDFQPQEQHDSKVVLFLSHQVSGYLLQKLWETTTSVQFSHSVMSDSLRPHEPQHARHPCPSPTPRVHPHPCLSSRWCDPTISSSIIPFPSCPQSFTASG